MYFYMNNGESVLTVMTEIVVNNTVNLMRVNTRIEK